MKTIINVTQDNKSYWIPVRRDMGHLLTDEVLGAFKWRDDTEDRSDFYRGRNGELEDC